MGMDQSDWEYAMAALQEEFEAEHPFGKAMIAIDDNSFVAAVATTVEQRLRGMQGRRFSSSFDCMAFVFPEERVVAFHNPCPFSIVIGFYDGAGEPVSIEKMAAGAGMVSSGEPVKYAIEFPDRDDIYDYILGRVEFDQSAFTAQETKLSPDTVHLRPAEPNAVESCATCEFFLGGTGCELVKQTVATNICDEYTKDEDFQPNDIEPTTVELQRLHP